VASPRLTRVLTLLSLLVLAAMGGLLVPQLRSTERRLRDRALEADLRVLNQALKGYCDDHASNLPGLEDGALDQDLMRRQLTLPSTPDGTIAPNGPCGPYLKAGIPPNPWNGLSELKVVTTASVPPPDGTTGWIVHVPSQRILSNARETER
jgi:type II secretory pathway pseudopilin PulG